VSRKAAPGTLAWKSECLSCIENCYGGPLVHPASAGWRRDTLAPPIGHVHHSPCRFATPTTAVNVAFAFSQVVALISCGTVDRASAIY